MTMILNNLAVLLICIMVTLFIYIPVRYKKLKKRTYINKLFEFFLCCTILWSVGVIGILLLPSVDFHLYDGMFEIAVRFPSKLSFNMSFKGITDFDAEGLVFGKVNLIPFLTIGEYFSKQAPDHIGQSDWVWNGILNVLGNLCLFVPFGLLLPIVSKKFQKLRYMLSVFTVCIIVVEFLQYFIGRSSDIDDLILNLTGIIIGFAVYKLFAGIEITKKYLTKITE